MDFLEFLLEVLGWIFDSADILSFWRFCASVAMGLLIGFAIFEFVPRRAIARAISIPVVITSAALGIIWETNRR